VARLGGPDDAVWPLSVYARAPRRLAPFRWAAAYLLWDCSDRAVPVLVRLLRDPDAEVRVMAARALSGRTDPRALGPLLRSLGDDSPGVRWWAAKGLGRIGSPRAVAALEAALADGDERVRAAAAEALKKIRGEEPPK
jgi:HEAT repeat protein